MIKLYKAFGEEKTLEKWVKDKRCVVKFYCLKARINELKYPIEKALTLIAKKREKSEISIGKIYNYVLINEIIGKGKNGHSIVSCTCLNNGCNKKFKRALNSIKMGHIKSCGCLAKETNKRIGPNSNKFKGYGEISLTFFHSIKNCAKKREIKFEIIIEQIWDLFLKQNRKCALSGVELKFESKSQEGDGFSSLDRIDSSKDYTLDNVQWVHKDVNIMKQDLVDKQFINWCHIISNHNK